MTKSQRWALAAAAVVAAASLGVALRARALAADARALALGHALDRSWHPRRPDTSAPPMSGAPGA
jgi:hypothetical protein